MCRQASSGTIPQLYCDVCGKEYMCEERLRQMLKHELSRLGTVQLPTTQAQYDAFVWKLQLEGALPSAGQRQSATTATTDHRAQHSQAALTGSLALSHLAANSSVQPPVSAASDSAPSALMGGASDASSLQQSPRSTAASSSAATPATAEVTQASITDAVAEYWAKIAVVQLQANSHDARHRTSCFKSRKGKNAECRHNCPHKPVPNTSLTVGMCALGTQ